MRVRWTRWVGHSQEGGVWALPVVTQMLEFTPDIFDCTNPDCTSTVLRCSVMQARSEKCVMRPSQRHLQTSMVEPLHAQAVCVAQPTDLGDEPIQHVTVQNTMR